MKTAPSHATRDTTANKLEYEQNTMLGFASSFGLMAFVALCFVLLMAPFYFSGFPQASVTIEDGAAYVPPMIFTALTVLGCLLLALSGEKAPPSPLSLPLSLPLSFLVAAFWAWCALSVIGAVYQHEAWLETMRVTACVIWFYIARTLLSSDETNGRVARQFYVVAAIVGGAAIVCGLALRGFIQDPNFRQFGTFFNPNLLANYCAMALPLALVLLFWRRGALVLFFSGAALFMILGGLVSTRSKGGLLALIAALLVFALCALKARGPKIKEALRAHRKFAIGAALLSIILGGALAQKTIVPRLGEDNSTQFRLYTWRGTTKMIAARPVLGWGPGSYASAYPQFAQTGFTLTAHQVWLQLAAEHGVPASLLLLAICGAAALKGWRSLSTENWPVAAGGVASLAAFFVHGLTDSGWSLISIALLLMIVVALLDSLPENSGQRSAVGGRHSALNYYWLGAALVFGIFSVAWARVVEGEGLAAKARESLEKRLPETALQQGIQATEVDPYSARLWHNRGRIKQVLGQNAVADFKHTIELQPTKATHYLSLAEELQRHNQAPSEVLSFYNRAAQLDPNDTTLRLARAAYLMEVNTPDATRRAWQDYEYIAALYDAPYGRHPAIAEMVNFDFVEAFVRLAERALQNKDRVRAVSLLQKAEAIFAVWQANAERNRDIARDSGTLDNFERQEKQAQEWRARLDILKRRL